MLKKTITWTDLNDNTVIEDYYFNLSKAEIAEMELSQVGGLSEYLQRIVKDENGGEIIKLFKDILTRAYGQKSEDGRRFIKSPELSQEFLQTEAYSELFMELVTDADAAAAFINGIIPKNLQDQIQTGSVRPRAVMDVPLPEPIRKNIKDMNREELIEEMKRKHGQTIEE